MSSRICLSCCLLLSCVVCPAPSAVAQAAAAFNVGQRVEVKKGTTWYRATIVKKEGTRFLVHFEGASEDFNEWVEAERIREAARSFVPPGATPRPQGDRPSSVQGPSDRQPENETPPQGDAPKLVQADSEGVQELTPPPNATGDWAVVPDAPAPPKRRITLQPVPLFSEPHRPGKPGRSFWERFTDVLFASPEAARAVLVRTGNTPGESRGQGRLECIDLALGKSVGFAEMPAATHAVDLSPDGSRVLLVSDVFSPDKKGRLDIGALAPKAEHIVSFKPYDSGEDVVWRRNVEWARFVDNTHLLTNNGRGELTLWEIPSAKAIYMIRIQGQPALSPGRKYLAAGVEKRLCFFEAATGKFVGRLPGEVHPFASPVFRPDGKRLAVLGGGRLQRWDLESAKPLDEMVLPHKAWSTRFDWLPDDSLLIGDRFLVDPRLRTVIWEYTGVQGRPASVFAGRYWYVAERSGSKVLASASIPEPAVRAAAGKLNPDHLMAVKPGVAVSLEVHADVQPDARERVIKSLTAKLKSNGLKVAENQPLRLLASSAPGETRQITYRMFGRRQSETLSVTDVKYRLAFELDGQPLWEATSTDSAPHFLTLQKDETAEQAVAKQRADAWKFLERTSLPKLIPDRLEKTLQGRSKLTAIGVETAPGPVEPEPAQ